MKILHVDQNSSPIGIHGLPPGRRARMLGVIPMWGTFNSSIEECVCCTLKITKPNMTSVVKGHEWITYSPWSVIMGTN